MPVATSVKLAMRCPECGKMEFHNLSRFVFSKAAGREVTCSCGAVKMVISTRNCRDYRIQIACVICEIKHTIEVSGKYLWSGEGIRLSCLDTDLDLGHIGTDEKVREMANSREHELESLVDEFMGEGYFHNSGIMYEVLNCLHDIAEQGSLYCQCGNYKIEVDIFPDRLELHCKNCDSINIIYAETEDDLKVIQQVDSIELARHGFKCLDSLANTGKLKKVRRKRNKT